jgi:cytochrome c2
MPGRLTSLVSHLAALAIVGAISVATSAVFFPISVHRIDIGRGAQIFERRCAVCHSVSTATSRLGPSLQDIGKTAASRLPNVSAEQYIFESILQPSAYKLPGAEAEMPENVALGLTLDELLSLAAYLCSQGDRIRYSRLLAVGTRTASAQRAVEQTVDLACAERGKELFVGQLNCAECHSLDGGPGSDLLGPRLTALGSHSREYIREAIMHPENKIVPGYETWQVSWRGLPCSGRRLPSDPGSVALLTTGVRGEIQQRSFVARDLEADEAGNRVWRLPGSSMPSYQAVLGEDDLGALVEFLSTVR